MISAAATTVATGTPALTGAALTTSYRQVIPATQGMLTACAHGLTAAYTLQ